VGPLLEVVEDWEEFLSEDLGKAEADALRRSERTGRPLGSESFMVWLEGLVGRRLRRRKPGPKPRNGES
jgi:putative transposase